MKAPCFSAFLAALFAVTLLSSAGAQVPFTSTSPPNSNPFGRSTGGLPPVRSAQPVAPSTPTGYPIGQSLNAAPVGAYAGVASYPGAAPSFSSGPIDPNHRLGRGDRLTFRVQEDRDDKVWPMVVTDSGELDVPYLGRLKAAGKSTGQLMAEVKSALEREYYYHATVIMGLDSVAPEASLGRVFVTGSVRSQGALDLPIGSTLSVSQAIVQAGGFGPFALQTKVKLIRKSLKEPIIVNVKKVLEGDSSKDVTVEPGDTIKVADKTLNFSM